MVKFCEGLEILNPKKVGRKTAVKREVKLLTYEWWYEKSKIRKEFWSLKERTFVSIYSGRICIGVILFRRLNKKKGIWVLSNAVIHDDIQGCGLGSKLTQCALRFAFANGCRTLYLEAACAQKKHRDGTITYAKPQNSGAFRFWSKMKFRRITWREYNKIFKNKKGSEFSGICPMKTTWRSRAATELPPMEDIIDNIFKSIRLLGKKIKSPAEGRRHPLLRLCTEKNDLCIY